MGGLRSPENRGKIKESPKEVEPWLFEGEATDSDDEKLRAQIDAAAKVTPNLFEAVCSVSVRERRETVLEIGNWIEKAIFDYYKPRGA